MTEIIENYKDSNVMDAAAVLDGPLAKYRKSASFDVTELKHFVDSEDIRQFRVIILFY